MTMAEFEQLVAAWGADPARWPAERRAEAQALAAEDTAAEALLRDARRLDWLLDAAPLGGFAEGDVDGIVRHAVGADAAGFRWPLRHLAAQAAALAACAALGVILGLSDVGPAPDDTGADDVALLAFGPALPDNGE